MSTGVAGQGTSTHPCDLTDSAITALFPRVTAVTLVVLLPLAFTSAKTFDWLAFLFAVAGSVLLGIIFIRRPMIAPSRLALVASIGGISCGIALVERPELAAYYWEGFGISVALLSLPLALLIVPIATRVCGRLPILARTLTVAASLVAIADAMSLVRDLGNFSYPYNNSFVLNEVLAPAAGRVPDANFIPQYTTLFGWLILPFRHLLSVDGLTNMSIIVLSGLGIVAVLLAVVLARRCLPQRSLWLAIALVVPLATVTVHHFDLTSIDSSIGSVFQEYPVRMFPAMLYSLFAVSSLVALLQGSCRNLLLISLGLLAGLIVWNNQDVGLAVVVAYGVMLRVATRGALRKRATALWLAGFAPGLILYPLWCVCIRHPLDVSFLGLADRSYGAGFGSAPIQIPGPVLLVMPVLLGSAVVGVSLLWKMRGATLAQPRHQLFAIATLALVGSWSAGSLPYYVNRSYASGQLQVFLLPLGVCCCALLSLCIPVNPGGNLPLTSGGSGIRSDISSYLKSRGLWLMPVTLSIAVGFGAVLQMPNPVVSMDRLIHPPASIGFAGAFETMAVTSNEISVVRAYARSHGGGGLSYFGPDASYVALLSGVQPRIIFDDPALFNFYRPANAFDRVGCNYVRRHPTRWLIVAPEVSDSTTICDIYEPLPVPGEPSGTVFIHRNL